MPATAFSAEHAYRCVQSVHRYMETALLHLVFHKAAVLLAHIVEHLAEHPFQCVVAHFATLRTFGVFHGLVAVVAHIEGGAVEVAAILGGIAVVSAKLDNVGLASKH